MEWICKLIEPPKKEEEEKNLTYELITNNDSLITSTGHSMDFRGLQPTYSHSVTLHHWNPWQFTQYEYSGEKDKRRLIRAFLT